MKKIPVLNNYGLRLLTEGKLDLVYMDRQREAARRKPKPTRERP